MSMHKKNTQTKDSDHINSLYLFDCLDKFIRKLLFMLFFMCLNYDAYVIENKIKK